MRQEGALWGRILSVFLFLLFFAFSAAAEAFFLPDTGQTTCYSVKGAAKVIECPSPESSSAQDGSYSLYPPSYTVNSDGTVTDNNTFLVWQQADDGIQHAWNEAVSYCENLSLGGHSDWRLPSRMELASIVDYGRFSPAVDSAPFLNTKAFSYWSSTEYPSDSTYAWFVNFYDGAANDQFKYAASYTRCVRGDETPADLRNNGDYTATDQRTGLMWQQLEGGQMKWSYALDYCEGLLFGGYSDWRLPNARELESLYDALADFKRAYPAMANSLPIIPSAGFYWSSTASAADTARRWTVSLVTGSTATQIQRERGNYVRCVRGQKAGILDYREISVDPSAADFGYSDITETTSRILTVTNIGNDDLVIGDLPRPLSPFSVSEDGCSGRTLRGWESCTVTVKFMATSPGVFTDIITIPSNDADHPDLKVGLWATVTLLPGGGYLLPDSGQTVCFSADGLHIGCPPPGDPLAQDGSYTTNPISFANNSDGTMTDNNTFFMWQRQDDNIQRTLDDAEKYCENLALGGHRGWRLPTLKETVSITDYNHAFGSTSSSGFPDSAGKNYTTVDEILPNELRYVKCVRGGSLPYGPLSDNGDGTVTDAATGLMWQQGEGFGTWDAVVNACEGLSLGGYSDWRLPNFKELVSLTNDNLYDPAVDITFFPHVNHSDYNWADYWTSTNTLYAAAGSSRYDQAYVVNFKTGGGGSSGSDYLQWNSNNARCVRGGNSAQSLSLTLSLTSPQDGAVINASTVTVTGTVNNTANVTVNKTSASVSGNTFAASVSLAEGQNTITANATDSYGRTASSSITVYSVTKGTITGTVKDSSSGLPIVSASVFMTDSDDAQFNAATDKEGNFTITSVSSGVFTGSIIKDDYFPYPISGTVYAGQTSVINAVLSPRLPTIENVGAVDITADSATITWTTDQSSDSLVEYGETTEYGNEKAVANLTTSHSVLLSGLKVNTAYHFRVTSRNAKGLSAISGDDTFTTAKFGAKFVGDFGNVAVMEVKGNYDSNNPDGTINYLPRQEIAKEFIKNHADDYDFMIIFSNFDFAMPEAEAKAFYLGVKNDVQGIGKSIFDESASFGSNKLQGMIDMGNISSKVSDPSDPRFEDTLATLAHEQMHRWGASVKFKDGSGNMSTALLGKDGAHWSYLLDSDASVMYGNDWQDNEDGTFTSTGKEGYYSALDLYLAGFYDKSQVPPMLLIDNPSIDPPMLPEVGVTIAGTAKYVTIDDIIAAEGERLPDVTSSQKTFKAAFILITTPNTFTGNELPGIENIRSGWAGRFAQLTGGEGSIADVAPDITIVITSPSNGSTIARPNVTVRGAVINTTGNETGVTVNGIVANVYGNQFIANHVLLAEGSNTLTITATDSAGTTASTAISVDTVAGDYIRLTSNIESGISPLEVTLRIDGSFSIEDGDLHIEGPAGAEIVDNPAPDEFEVKFTSEGIYYVTASTTGPDGNVYEDTIAITVINREQLDRLLKAKWEGMKGALAVGDTDKAVSYIAGTSQNMFSYNFELLKDYLSLILQDMGDISVQTIEGRVAEYEMLATQDGVEKSFYVEFVTDLDGIWRISFF
jgi:hypothetical protein